MLFLVSAAVGCRLKNFSLFAHFHSSCSGCAISFFPRGLSKCANFLLMAAMLVSSQFPYNLKTAPIAQAIAGTVADYSEQPWH
jgi:hypothetical protein